MNALLPYRFRVIAKNNSRLGHIKKAAETAAWYSAEKHSELVPVMYTLKKYVRRGKNLPAGQVIFEREEVVIVRPSKTEHRTHKQ